MKNPLKACVFDTETGGIGAEAAQNWSIIQLGAVVYNDGLMPGLDDSFSCVIDESKAGLYLHLQPEALAVNGFTVDRIKQEGVHPGLAALRFVNWLHRKFTITPEQRLVLMGHNVGYDVSFLQRLFRIAGCLPAYEEIFHYRALDTSTIRRFLLDAGLANEDEVELTPEKPHDALSDAIATGHLYTKMKRFAQFPLHGFHPSFGTISERVLPIGPHEFLDRPLVTRHFDEGFDPPKLKRRW